MQKNKNEGSYSRAFENSRKRMQQLSPDKISKSSLIQYDWLKNCLVFESFGQEIEISYPEGQVCFKGTDEKLVLFGWDLMLLNYLSNSKELPVKNEWVSYRELPQGNVFYPNIKTHVLEALSQFFTESNKKLIRNALAKLGFIFVESKADIAATAKFVPRVPVLIQFWEGEDEVPSSCQILFDRTIADQMHIEDAAGLCSLIKELIITQYCIEKNQVSGA
jgi:hypothetical protein